MKITSFFLLLSFSLFSFNIDSIDSIYIGTIKIENVYQKNDIIHYPNIEFVKDTFLNSFIKNFNQKQIDMPSNTLIFNPTHQKIISKDKVNYKSSVYQNKYFFFKNNFDYKKLLPKERNYILFKNKSNYWMSLDLKTSLWQQRIWGNITLYLNNRTFYKKRINITSHYFILDKDSPYRSSLDNKLNIKDRSRFQTEIKQLYAKLGRLLALKIKRNFLDIIKLDIYKQKQKDIRKFYKTERKSTTPIPGVKIESKTKSMKKKHQKPTTKSSKKNKEK